MRLLQTLSYAVVIIFCLLSLSGVLRYYLATTLETGLLLALLTVGPFLTYITLRRKHPSNGEESLPFVDVRLVILCALGVFTWLLYLMWVSAFNGFPTVGGGDSGNHVTILRTFALSDVRIYEGFIVFHTLAYWLQKVGAASFEFYSFRALFYSMMFVLTVSVPAIAIAFLEKEHAQKFLLRLSFLLIVWITFVVVPVYGYQQADGFMAHVFGMVPLLGIWMVYAFSSSFVVRTGLLFLGIVIYRHTYGLNLSDLLLSSGILLVLERPFNDRLDFTVIAVGIALVFASAFAYYKINSIIAVPGAIVPNNIGLGVLASAIGIAWLAREKIYFLNRGQSSKEAQKARFVDFVLVFTAVSTIAQVVLWILHPSSNYYTYKYSLHSQTLLGITICVVMSSKPAKGRWKEWVLTLSILLALAYAHRKLRNPALERAFGAPPYSRLSSLVDMETYHLIKETIVGNPNKSAFLIDPSWPRFNFTNALFGYISHGSESRKTAERGCFFWYETPSQFEKLTTFDQGGVIPFSLVSLHQDLRAIPGKECKEMDRLLDNERAVLCVHCQ